MKLRVLPRFPANISGANGITVVRDGVDLVVKPKYGDLTQVPSVIDNTTAFFTIWNSTDDYYSRMSFEDVYQTVRDTFGFMTSAMYDPQGIEADAFDRANHTGTNTPSDGTVTTAKIVDLNVTRAKLAAAVTDELDAKANTSRIPSTVNFSLAATVASNALTIALKGVDGNDPSASNPVTVPFRNVSLASGVPASVVVTGALSLVISSGSTLGFTSAVAGRLWVVLFNDGGTARLGVVNVRSGGNVARLNDVGLASSTAEGGAGAADSAQVIYTGTAVAAKAFVILGYLDWATGLATAGTWNAAPTTIHDFTVNTPLPGQPVARVSTDFSAVATGTTTIPVDDTIPQITEGNEYMTQAITPSASPNVLQIEARGFYANTAAASAAFIAALFQDATANALKAAETDPSANNAVFPLELSHSMVANSSSSTTFRVRAGCSAAGTTSFNGSGGTRRLGGVMNSFMSVTEIMA